MESWPSPWHAHRQEEMPDQPIRELYWELLTNEETGNALWGQHQRDWDLCLHSSVVSNISSTLAPHFRDEQKVCHHNFLFISAVIISDHWFKIIKVLGPPCHYSYLISPGHDATEGGGDPLIAAVVNGLTGPGKLLDSLPAAAIQLKKKYNVISSGSCSPYLSLNDILALLINLLPAQMQNISNL